jgi:homogentisate 1,2-dioxygenase
MLLGMQPIKKNKTSPSGVAEGAYEEELGRQGFGGRSARLQHLHPPTGWTRFEGRVRPHSFDLGKLEPRDLSHHCGAPLAVLINDDIRVMLSRRSDPMPYYMRNSDGDQLVFVHRGEGIFETDFGPVPFEKGDFILLPRSVTYRAIPKTTNNFFIVIQSKGEFTAPDSAELLTPEPSPLMDGIPPGGGNEWEVRIKHEEEYSKVFYPYNPLDVLGWEGDLVVWKTNLRDFQEGAVFSTPGAVLSKLLPNSTFQRNPASDEFTFYHEGDFAAAKPGMATLHPRGLHHGPHPKELSGKTRASGTALRLETLRPLHIQPAAEIAETKDYWASWMAK